MIRAALAIGLAVLCVAAGGARAGSDDDRRALVLLRVLAYDRNLVSRAGDRVTILVVYEEPDGDDERDRWLVALAGARKIIVAGREVVTRTHKFTDQARLAEVVGDTQATAIVVCGGLAQRLPAIRAVARARRAMTFTTRESEVAAGFSVGLVAGEHRDVLAINTAAAHAEGVQFEAGLLKIAKRIGKDAP